MKALWTTIGGDAGNVGVVAALVLIEFLLARSGHAMVGSILVPFLALSGIAWLARR